MWSEEFEIVLRRHCRLADPAAALAPDVPLTSLGATSMEIISLIVDLEDAFGLQIPDDGLTPQAFATPRTLWAMLDATFRLTGRGDEADQEEVQPFR